ncbi:tetratricopeptide repeat protein [Streptomyces hirsutus]|uniref:tetratricopeptide repeat protein n=1 Tax=Streptomyces hirsutus TaxID=35620 RepID=UPI0033C9E87E
MRGDLDQAAAAFECALFLDSVNWPLYLDLADVRAEQGDFAAAADLVEQGLEYEPHEVALHAAGAAYRTRLSDSSDDLKALIALTPEPANPTYRNHTFLGSPTLDQLVWDPSGTFLGLPVASTGMTVKEPKHHLPRSRARSSHHGRPRGRLVPSGTAEGRLPPHPSRLQKL